MAGRVLIVEDDRDNRTIYSSLLRFRGYYVQEAVDGDEGLIYARTSSPDLILLDISLPGRDGWNVCAQLKLDPETSSIPIIALTAHAYEAEKERGRELGFAAYLTKPIEPNKVVAAVESFIGRP